MPLVAGDKCPACREGLLERSPDGLRCTQCPWDMELAEVVAANKRETTEVESEKFKWKPPKISFVVDTPEEAEILLRGLILARQNNNSEYLPVLIDALNDCLEPWRAAKLRAEMNARHEAGIH